VRKKAPRPDARAGIDGGALAPSPQRRRACRLGMALSPGDPRTPGGLAHFGTGDTDADPTLVLVAAGVRARD
jgi:hypothetical protein